MARNITRQDSERLIKYGFVKDPGKNKKLQKIHAEVSSKPIEEKSGVLADYTEEELASYADHEVMEKAQFNWIPTPFPSSAKSTKLWWETFNMSIEEAYFWVLEYMRTRLGFANIVKTADVFSAAENSAFFGVSQQRIGLQQDKVSQFLATIGKMVKELFQLVRELRIIDERLEYYEDSFLEDRKRASAAEITLKGIFIDMVEQGAKNPASVYGMARELQFATLPDLFFSIHPRTPEDVESSVESLKFNEMVKRVLKRKLYSFIKWKQKTHQELKSRRIFTLKYLNQHWEIIRMYMNWVRPYLRHIKRLTMDEEKTSTPDLISAFEGSMVEIEIVGNQLPYSSERNPEYGQPRQFGKRNTRYHSVLLCHFLFRTRPAMSYQQEGYNRGPVHVGKLEMELKAYVWTKDQIDAYINMKDDEDFELMEAISGSVKAAMESLGEELMKYLREAKARKAEEIMPVKEVKASQESFSDLLLAPMRGMSEIFGGLMPKGKPKKNVGGLSPAEDQEEKQVATDRIVWCLWETHKNFKKEHKMLWW